MRIPVALFVAVCCLLGLAIGASAAGQVAFEPLGPGYGPATTYQIALGDLDGDGDLDAVFANQGDTPSRVLLNDGHGTFSYTDQLLTTQGHGVAIGDLNGDGTLDVVITCATFWDRWLPTRVYLNDGHGKLSPTAQQLGDAALSGNQVELADIDSDGDLDISLSLCTADFVTVSRTYLNDGLGGFSAADYAFPYGTTFADLDGDGDADAFSKVSGVGYSVLLQARPGVYEPGWQLADPSVAFQLHCFALGDLDGDGDLDVLDTTGARTVPGASYVLMNDGTGAFDRKALQAERIILAWPALADFNLDGSLDVALALFGLPDRIWIGDGTGGFADSGERLGGNLETRGLAVGDLDNDGDLDLVIPVFGGTGGMAVVWRNQVLPSAP